MEAQVSLTVGLQLICIVGSGVSHPPLDQYPIDSLWGSGQASLLANQAHQQLVIEPAFGTFGSVGKCQVLLENEISISIKLVSRRKHEVL